MPGDRKAIIGPNGAGKTDAVQPDHRDLPFDVGPRCYCSAKT